MFGTYPVMIDGVELGELHVRQDGIMTLFEAACADTGSVLRLSVYGDAEGYLGVMLPDGNGMQHLRKRLSRAAMTDFPKEIRFAGRAGQTQEIKPATETAEESASADEEQARETNCEMPQAEPEAPETDCAYVEESSAETEVQWRRAAGGALVGTQGQLRYLAVPLKSGVAPVGGNFEKRRIEQDEYAVFEIKNGKII